MANYGALVSGGLTFAGVDQGIDFTGSGSVLALGDGVVTRAIKHGSGWPGEGAILVYLITSGPAKGKYVYVAEDFAIARGVKVGTRIKAGQVVGTATGSGRAPGIEVGWANSSGQPVAPLGKNKRASTGAGQDFLKFVTKSAGADSATAQAQSTGPTEAPAALPDFSGQTQVGPQLSEPTNLPPGSVPATGFSPRELAQTWQLIAAQPGAQQDTQQFAGLFG